MIPEALGLLLKYAVALIICLFALKSWAAFVLFIFRNSVGPEDKGGSCIPSFRRMSLQNTGNSNQLCCWETKMTICTCVYNYLCQKFVLAGVRVFVYWCSDAPSLNLGSFATGDGKD